VKIILRILGVIFAVYLLFLLISSIDFSGMSFSDIKFVVTVCVGIAVWVISAAKGVNIIVSALFGLITAAILHALILLLIESI